MLKNDNNLHKYDDIINLPHHISTKHPHMSLSDRAAQFSPFAALTGYNDAIEETARLTKDKAEISESDAENLNRKFEILKKQLKTQPKITITYFKPDDKKSGGEYVKTEDVIKKIDDYNKYIITFNGTKIPFENIYNIDSDFFDETDIL